MKMAVMERNAAGERERESLRERGAVMEECSYKVFVTAASDLWLWVVVVVVVVW